MSDQLLLFLIPHTKLLTTVTTYHQEFSIFSSLKSNSLIHFLQIFPSPTSLPLVPWFMFSYELFWAFSVTLSPLLATTVSSLFALKKMGKKIENLVLSHFPASASLETAVARAAVLAVVVILSLDITQSFFYWAATAACRMLLCFPHSGLILDVFCLETWMTSME